MLTKQSIQELIATNDAAVIRGIMAIYSLQTDQEKCTQDTVERNGIGFNGTDGRILSSFAEWYKKSGFLSKKQIEISRPKMMKYWKQLLQIAESKGYEVSYK